MLLIFLYKFFFWFTLLLCVSSYFVYPIIIFIISRIENYSPQYREYQPTVTIIISAFNEEKHIREKIKNTLELNYPPEKIEIIVGSDGSTDKTVLEAKKIKNERVKVLDFKENRGKTAVQNDCVDIANGEILIFTDAASFLSSDSINKMVSFFIDPQISCVAGRMIFMNTKENLTTESQGIFWLYESMIRKLESSLGRLVGVDGPLYAVRKSNFIYLKDHVISDFILPLLNLYNGRKVILDEKAIVLEQPTGGTKQEFGTRRRVTLRALIGLKEHSELLNVFNKTPLAFQIIFHKLIRWFVGILLVVNWLSCLLLINSPFYSFVMICYFIFFVLAYLGLVMKFFEINLKILAVPYYFIIVNLASTLAILDFVRKKYASTWIPARF